MDRRLALHGLVAGAFATLLPTAARAAGESVRVTTLPIDSSLEVHYAQSHGFTESADLAPVIQMMGNGAAVMAAVVGGATDIGNSNLFSILAARQRGIPVVIVAPCALYNTKAPTSVLMVPNDSSIRNARELNGKTIAVDGLRNITQYAPMAWIDKNGGQSSTVRFVEIPFPDMPLALAAHRVDAALIAEPAATRARKEARLLGKAYDGIASRFEINAWFASESWVSKNTDVAKRFATMIYRTATWANANPAATATILSTIGRLDESLVKTMPRATFAERADPALIDPVIEVALRYGAITTPVRSADLFAATARS